MDEVVIPRLVLPSVSNLREHWAQRARRAKVQRSLVYYALLAHTAGRRPQGPVRILLIRQAPRALDGDNLQASLKACRDGVADWLAGRYGGGQDEQPGLTWGYQQRAGPCALCLRMEAAPASVGA